MRAFAWVSLIYYLQVHRTKSFNHRELRAKKVRRSHFQHIFHSSYAANYLRTFLKPFANPHMYCISCNKTLLRIIPATQYADIFRGNTVSQGPLKKWTEHSNCQIHSRGDPYSFTDTQNFHDCFYEIIFLCI